MLTTNARYIASHLMCAISLGTGVKQGFKVTFLVTQGH